MSIFQGMKERDNIINELKDHYFWDVDSSQINPEGSKRLVIERVFSLGDIKDIKAIINYYGTKEVAEQLASVTYLDPKTLNFASVLFNKPKSEFRCYTPKPSSRKHWNS